MKSWQRRKSKCKNKNQKKIKIKLQTILVILVILVVVCSVMATTYSCYRAYSASLLERVATSRNDVLAQISTKVDLIQSNMDSLSKLYYSIVKDGKNGDIQALFQNENQVMTVEEIMDAYQNASDMEFSAMILDGDGYCYAVPKIKNLVDAEERQKQRWYLNIPSDLEEDTVYWTQPHKDSAIGSDFYLSAARRICSENEQIITVLLSVSEQMLYQAYQNVIGDNNSIYLVDGKGRILSSSENSLVGLNYFNMKRLNELVSSNNYTITEKSGVKYLLSRYDNLKYNLTYLEEIPLDTLLSALSAVQRRSVFIAIVAVILACAAVWVIVRILTSPLLMLCKKLERVGNGYFDTKFDIKSWSEVTFINDVCDEMAQKISSLFDNLKEEERQKRLAEIEFLQAQINPHFMYNTLFEIKCLVNIGENEDAEWMLKNFIAMLKTILSNKDEMISLQEELVILQQYFAVMQCKYGEEILLTFEIPQELLECEVLKFMLQPIVENSIFHGLEPVGNKGNVKVKVWREQEFLMILVEDNGIGMEESKLEEVRNFVEIDDAGGVGISNVVKRIKLHFGDTYGAKIQSKKNQGTKVLLCLPYLVHSHSMEGGE